MIDWFTSLYSRFTGGGEEAPDLGRRDFLKGIAAVTVAVAVPQLPHEELGLPDIPTDWKAPLALDLRQASFDIVEQLYQKMSREIMEEEDKRIFAQLLAVS